MFDINRRFRVPRTHFTLVALLPAAIGAVLALSSTRPVERGQASAAARAGGRPLSIEDYYRIKTVGSPELSPDGRWVAFTVGTRVEETNGNQSEVWLVGADASSPERRVSAGGVDASAPQWTSDGLLRFSAGNRTYLYDPGMPGKAPEATATPAGGGRGGGRGGARRCPVLTASGSRPYATRRLQRPSGSTNPNSQNATRNDSRDL